MGDEKKLIPEFRFPEFENDGEWEEKTLSDIADNLDAKRIPITSNQREKGVIPYYGASGIIDYVKNYIFNENLLCISEDGANLIDRNYPIAFSIKGKTWVNNHAHVLKFMNSSTQFLVEKYINAINIEDFLTGAAQPKLNRGQLDIIPITLPKNPKEQQKIASCLSNLDDLIAAHNDKLKALKDHKKGLLQNLFPQEGENVPKYRFPEFEGKEEWRRVVIGDVTQVTSGGTPDSTNVDYWKGDIPWMNSGELNNKRIYSVSNFITRDGLKNSSTKLIPPECVLIGLAGQGKTRGTAAINYFQLCTNQSIAAILPNKKVFISEFLYQLIDSMYEKLRALSAGDGGRGGLNLTIINSIELLLPGLEEQQKIASCLFALDELINAQADKIEQLKIHKKGLMQGLFPQIDA